MNIPEKAIEAAAKTHYGHPWDRAPQWAKDEALETAREMLEAAAPFIAAQAWEEGREALALDFTRPFGPDGMRPSTPNPYGDPQ